MQVIRITSKYQIKAEMFADIVHSSLLRQWKKYVAKKVSRCQRKLQQMKPGANTFDVG
jgi:hypothetical protein